MSQAKLGSTVKVHYRGTLQDGTEFDSSAGRDPLQFTVGDGAVLGEFEMAVVGMSPGDKKTFTIKSEAAYGEYDNGLVMEFDKGQLPPTITPEVGLHLQFEQEDGQEGIVKIIKVTDTKIAVDANHPLAGKDLTFNIQLLDVA